MILRDSTITGNLGGVGGNGGNPGSGGGDGMTAPPHGSGGNAGNGSAGGGIFVSSTATASLVGVTIAANTPGAPGTPGPSGGTGGSEGSPGNPAFAGGIDQSGSSAVALADTLLSLNPSGNCHGTIGNTGDNLSFGDGTCPSTFAGGDPKLVALADNGGPTETMDLGSGSAAIDAGGTLCRPTDQRGLPRPSGAACDIGAYEVTPPAVSSLASTAVTSHGATLTASVTPNARGDGGPLRRRHDDRLRLAGVGSVRLRPRSIAGHGDDLRLEAEDALPLPSGSDVGRRDLHERRRDLHDERGAPTRNAEARAGSPSSPGRSTQLPGDTIRRPAPSSATRTPRPRRRRSPYSGSSPVSGTTASA